MARLNMKQPYCTCACHKMPEDYSDPIGHIAQTCPCRARVGRFQVQNPPLEQLEWCEPKYSLKHLALEIPLFGHYASCAKWQYDGYKCTCKPKKEGKKMNKRRRLEQLKRAEKLHENTLLRVEEEIAQLEEELANRPEEPPVDSVIAFNRQYEKNGRVYSFVAFRAHGDRWYLSQDGVHGARTPSMDWDELLDFIGDNDIFWCTSWEKWT